MRFIRELAKDDDNIYLVNTEEEFNRKSPFGIPGRELLLEHVHPTIRRASGDRKIAFLEVLRQKPILFFPTKNYKSALQKIYTTFLF